MRIIYSFIDGTVSARAFKNVKRANWYAGALINRVQRKYQDVSCLVDTIDVDPDTLRDGKELIN